jgi:hypothetical protein
MRMSTARVAAILAASSGHLDALQAAALAGPAGGWIGAGFLRNAVWDALSGRPPSVATLADLDVVHHDPARDAAADAGFEAALKAARPLPWSVVNQARMADRNGHVPYRDLATALAHWPETATAVAMRLRAGRIEILAPHGLDDLLGLVVRPTPAHAADPRVVLARLAAKGWAARWPALRVATEGDAGAG